MQSTAGKHKLLCAHQHICVSMLVGINLHVRHKMTKMVHKEMLSEDPNYWYLLRVTSGRIDCLLDGTMAAKESAVLSTQPVCCTCLWEID